MLPEQDDAVSNQYGDQSQAVSKVFNVASATWSQYYNGHANSLSHLDLTVRLRVASAMLQTACTEADGAVFLLDVGCGTGEGTSLLSRDQLKVFAVDLSAAMVGRAVGRHGYLYGSAANAMYLPFADEIFDVVLSLGTLEYISPCENAMKEFRRVLKPGATLIFSFPNRASWFRRLDRIERALTRPLRRIRATLSGTSGEDAGLVETFRHQSWTLSEVERFLKNSNFELVEMRQITYGLLLPMAESWKLNLALCRWMNAHCSDTAELARHLACTSILHVRAV